MVGNPVQKVNFDAYQTLPNTNCGVYYQYAISPAPASSLTTFDSDMRRFYIETSDLSLAGDYTVGTIADIWG